MAVLENECLAIEINERGELTRLENKRTGYGNLIVEPKPLSRFTLHTMPNTEDMADGAEQKVTVTEEDGGIVLKLDAIRSVSGDHAIEATMRVALDGDHVRFDGTITNHDASTVAEWIYPCIGAMKTLDEGKMDLCYPRQAGVRYGNIGRHLSSVSGPEFRYTIGETYPGPLSMAWMMLTGKETCLYLASEDEMRYLTALRAVGSRACTVTLEINKMAFVKPGETWEYPRAVLRLYTGSWREGADEYAAFASTWRHHVPTVDWMRRMNGYFLVINKQQYGDEIWPYESLPELYELAEAHGCDTLGLFGWYHSGHDNNYPDLEVSPTLGGREKLEEGIRRVHEMGGRVTLYYQGHLMDVNSPFYRKMGHQVECLTLYGNPYYEYYPKACRSDFGRYFSQRVFSTACASSPEWQDLMAERVDWLASFGADGTLYDQLGGAPTYPCFNEKHTHALGKPTLSDTQERPRLLARIREKTAQYPGFAFMSEHFTDCYSAYLDCIHGIGTSAGNQYSEETAGDGVRSMPEMFRYCFPETPGTTRCSHPKMKTRDVNYAFEFGFKFEIELRYRSDKADVLADFAAAGRVYAKAVADLRRKYEKYLLLGTFREAEGVKNPYRTLYVERFVAEDGTSALALWNDSTVERSTDGVTFDGKALHWETITASGDGMISTLRPNEIAVVVLGNEGNEEYAAF